MAAGPITCPRCDTPSGVAARFCSQCGHDLSVATPASEHRAGRLVVRIVRSGKDRLARIAAGFARLILAFAGGVAAFFATFFAIALAGFAKADDWLPWLSFIPGLAALLVIGFRSEELFVRHARFCPHCGEMFTLTTPTQKTPGRAAEPPTRQRGLLAAIGHDVVIFVAALALSAAAGKMVAGLWKDPEQASGWVPIVGYFSGCVAFVLLFARSSDLFRDHGHRTESIAGGLRRLSAAVAGAALVFLTSYVLVYFGRLDVKFGAWLWLLTFASAPAALLVLFTWPQLYRSLSLTRLRAAGSVVIVLSLVAGQAYALVNVDRLSLMTSARSSGRAAEKSPQAAIAPIKSPSVATPVIPAAESRSPQVIAELTYILVETGGGSFRILTVYDDGLVLTGSQQRRLSLQGVQALREEIGGTGLFDKSKSFAAFHRHSGTHWFVIAARVATDLVEVRCETCSIGEASFERSRFAGLADQLEILESWLPPGSWADAERTPYIADHIGLFTRSPADPIFVAADLRVDGGVLAWPLQPSIQEYGVQTQNPSAHSITQVSAERCGVVTRTIANAVLASLARVRIGRGDEPSLDHSVYAEISWPNGDTTGLALIPLRPEQSDCGQVEVRW